MNDTIHAESQKLSMKLAPKVGFDPISIILLLLPMLLDCFKKTDPTGDPKEFLRDHQDDDGTFDDHIVRRERPRTRRAARQAGKHGLKPRQLDEITVAAFQHTLEADDATVAAAMA